jgi:uncharacterized alpha-E superfamily protein
MKGYPFSKRIVELKPISMYSSLKMAQNISITQALAELKLLDKRIQKALSQVTWADVNTKSHPVDAEKFARAVRAEYQSFNDLVKRRDTIKRAVVKTNATTRVKVGVWEGTVAEAIEYKASIFNKKQLLEIMRRQLLTAKQQFKEQQESVDARLEKLLHSELGKDVRTSPETITALTNSFRENNKVELVDPLDLSERAKELEEEIESFETNVDWVLSETNGKTMIAV